MTQPNKNNQLVFLSNPEIGNLVPTVQFAKHLLHHHPCFYATVLIISMPQRPIVNTFIQSLPATSSNIHFLHLPSVDPPSPDQYRSSLGYISLLIEKHKPHVKQAIAELASTESGKLKRGRVAALFLDMFCTSMTDVAEELRIPSYLFFASPATFLSFMLELPVLDPQLTTDSVTELVIPGFANSVPRRVLPPTVLKQRDGYTWYLYHARRYSTMKGIVVNTFRELESYCLNILSTREGPRVYPVGPIIDLIGPAQWHPDRAQYECVVKWLDNQPPLSVLFLCFGSMRSLSGPQAREIAVALERVGVRFLWALREPPKNKLGLPSEYNDLNEVLPSGFLERTVDTGLVCGWVPQAKILAHRAIGGFVSHCGWNSILESVWFGVPIATWPIFAEQQINAFEMVKELGLGVEIRLDYREDSDLVLAEEVENGIKTLMKGDSEVRTKMKDMREKSRITLMENGSSFESLKSLVDQLKAD
ncbi:hypothetical protein UlMin_019956 [Ulmus minor]